MYKHYAVWLESGETQDITAEVDELIESGEEQYAIDFGNVSRYFTEKLGCDVVVGSAESEEEAIERGREEVDQY